ncbi:MAG TPA: sigma-70 family RNA polymerase sigma factor [Pyrinomonadaceae bacterium]|nr:sigma-70 family RNA polymerase sigma factor [Pyrinomonadaceae bacterium]
MDSNDDKRQLPKAQQYLLDHWPWLEQTCDSLLERNGLQNGVNGSGDLLNNLFVQFASFTDHTFDGIDNPKAYIYTVLSRATRRQDAYDRKRDDRDIDEFANHSDGVGHNPAKAAESAILLKELFETLPPEGRHLLELLIKGLSGREIALELGITEAAARQRISRLGRDMRHRANGGK